MIFYIKVLIKGSFLIILFIFKKNNFYIIHKSAKTTTTLLIKTQKLFSSHNSDQISLHFLTTLKNANPFSILLYHNIFYSYFLWLFLSHFLLKRIHIIFANGRKFLIEGILQGLLIKWIFFIFIVWAPFSLFVLWFVEFLYHCFGLRRAKKVFKRLPSVIFMGPAKPFDKVLNIIIFSESSFDDCLNFILSDGFVSFHRD